MQTIVFFSNHGIQILQGTIKGGQLNISRFKTLPLEDGALINGVITNEESVREVMTVALSEDKNLFRNVKLVIDSSLIVTKNVEVPKLKPKELATLAGTEFEDTAGNYDDLLVDYAMIPGFTGRNLFCCGVEKRVLESYITLFENMKIKIMSIDVGLNAIIQYVTGTKDFKALTCALNILDGKDLVSILFENGVYVFSTRNRMLAERGTNAFAGELSAKLSSLIQFNRSQQTENPLKLSLYAGLDEDELNGLRDLNNGLDIELYEIPQTPNIKDRFNIDEHFNFGRYLYPIAGFFVGTKAVNFYNVFKQSNIVKKEINVAYKALIVPAAMILFFLLVFGIFFGMKFMAERRLADANQYINDTSNQEEYLKANNLVAEVDKINAEVSNMENLNRAIASHPNVTAEKLNHLATLCNGVIELDTIEYEDSTGEVHMTAMAKTESDASAYVERIKSTQYFSQVDYTGYAKVDMTKTETTTNSLTNSTTTTITKSSGFSFTVDAYMKAGTNQ